jgi:hypothetical protein
METKTNDSTMPLNKSMQQTTFSHYFALQYPTQLTWRDYGNIAQGEDDVTTTSTTIGARTITFLLRHSCSQLA